MRKEIRLHEIQAPSYDCSREPVMDVNRIRELLPHRYPFQLVDKVIEIGANYIVGIKNITANEPFFQGHFPQEPVMPGVLQVEAMAHFEDPYLGTRLAFVSPGGLGVKLFIPGDETVRWAMSYIQLLYADTFKGEVDTCGKDIARCCFLSHDSNAKIFIP